VFKIDRTTGALKPVPGSPFAGKNQPQAVAASKNLVYVGNRSSNDISVYILDPTNGALSPVGGSLLQTLKTLPGTCGSYSLRIDAINVNLATVKRNPVAVTVTLPDGSSGCLAINNALIDQ